MDEWRQGLVCACVLSPSHLALPGGSTSLSPRYFYTHHRSDEEDGGSNSGSASQVTVLETEAQRRNTEAAQTVYISQNNTPAGLLSVLGCLFIICITLCASDSSVTKVRFSGGQIIMVEIQTVLRIPKWNDFFSSCPFRCT